MPNPLHWAVIQEKSKQGQGGGRESTVRYYQPTAATLFVRLASYT